MIKKAIDGMIKYFSYKHPYLWLQINEDIFMLIENYHKRQKEKMSRNVRKLMVNLGMKPKEK